MSASTNFSPNGSLGIPKPTKADRPKRPSRDPAQPDARVLEAIWTCIPTCVITNQRSFLDPAHILGRGEAFGYQWKDPERKWFSSPFNIVPLCRPIHAGPYRDSVEMRTLFLRIARRAVWNAVRLGAYKITESDEQFLLLAGQWLRENPYDLRTDGQPGDTE